MVHTHNSKAGILGRLAARLAGVPAVIHTVHGFAFHGREASWRRLLFRNLERMASHWCDRMIFISQPLIDWALKDGILADKKKTVKIYSGIQIDRFHPVAEEVAMRTRRKWNIRPQDAVVGVVSKLWKGKGLSTLIKTVYALRREGRDVTLVIVGEGYLYDRLSRLVEGYGIENSVIFPGFQKDVSEIMGTFDVAVLSSFFEGMGRVLLEAMAMEKPVVASRVGGIPDLVEDGVNGFLVPPGSVGEWLDALRRLIDDRELATRMGKEGRKRITGRFSADNMVESIQKVYEQVLREKRPAQQTAKEVMFPGWSLGASGNVAQGEGTVSVGQGSAPPIHREDTPTIY